jgi:hypothetical protein
MRNRWLALATVSLWAAGTLLFGQRGGGGRGGAGGPRGPQSTMGEPHGPMQQQAGMSEQQRQRIRANDAQREQYRITKETTSRVRTRAHEMLRLAKAAKLNLAECRSVYASLQNEIQLMQQEHEQLIVGLSEEQKAATRATDKEIDADLKELDVWAEAMDEELKESSPDPKQVRLQARAIEKSAKELEKKYRRLDSALDLE